MDFENSAGTPQSGADAIIRRPGYPAQGRVITHPPGLRDNARDTLAGIALIALSYFIMTVGDVSAKWSLPVAGVVGAMVWRGVFGAGAVALIAVASRAPDRPGWRRLIPRRWKMVLGRSVLHTFVTITWYVAWMRMSLADSYAIGFTSPLVITLLAVPLLGERIRWRRALSTAIGFGGVLVMLRPGGDLWTSSTLLLLAGIIGLAVSRIMTRLLSTTETVECLSFFMLVAHIPVGLLLLRVFPPPGVFTTGIWLSMIALGLTNGVAHCLMARSYALAPVSALAPYEYTVLLWGCLFGFVVFAEVPSWRTLAGAAVVVAAGLYNLNRERMLRVAERAAA